MLECLLMRLAYGANGGLSDSSFVQVVIGRKAVSKNPPHEITDSWEGLSFPQGFPYILCNCDGG